MRDRCLALAILLVLVATATVPLAGQAAEADGPRVVILQDGPPDAATYVGQLNTFGWLLFDDEGEPSPHHDAVFRVQLNGQTLVETTDASGHDYDGIDPYQVVFPEPGEYTVSVEVPLKDGGTAEANLTGEVRPAPADAPDHEVHIDAPEQASTGETVEIRYGLHAGDGHDEGHEDGMAHDDGHDEGMATDHLSHTDATVSIRDAETNFETFRTHTHGHDGMQSLDHVFEAPGTYEIRVTGYSDNPKGPSIGPVVATHEITVDGHKAPPAVPTIEKENVVHAGTADGDWSIYATYDPYTVTGPHGRMRLGTVLVDGSGDPVPHVDYSAEIRDPMGNVLFASEDLHEHDGVLEVVTHHPRTGDYTMTVEASVGNRTATATHQYAIYPPAIPTGPMFTTLRGADDLSAGERSQVVVRVASAGDQPFIHSEVDYVVRDASDGAPLLSGKLHTHDSGDFPVNLTLPRAGDYVLDLSPTSLEPTATPRYYGPEPGTRPTFDLTVAPGPGLPSADVDDLSDDTTSSGASVPSAGLVVAVVAIGAAAVVHRRR